MGSHERPVIMEQWGRFVNCPYMCFWRVRRPPSVDPPRISLRSNVLVAIAHVLLYISLLLLFSLEYTILATYG